MGYTCEARVKCKNGYDGGLITWISAKPTDSTPEVNFQISWKRPEKSVLCGEFRAPRSPRFYRLVLPALPHLRLRHRCRRTLRLFIMCPSSNTKWEYEWTSTRRPVTNPVTGRRTSTDKTRYRLNCQEERCNRKRIHTHFLKDRNCEMQEGQNYLDSM